MWTSSTPGPWVTPQPSPPPFAAFVCKVVFELQRVHQQLLAARHLHVEAPARRAAQREAGQSVSAPHVAAARRRRDHLDLQLRALQRRSPRPRARTRTSSAYGHHLAQVPDLHLDAATTAARPRAGPRSPPRIRRSRARASADPRQRVADQLVHHAPAAERGLDQHHARRLGPDLADLGRPLAARARSAARRARRPRPPAPRTRRTCPRWRRTAGRCRAARDAPATAGATGTAASCTSIATPEARASSLSTDATPPRVASRMHRRDGPAASSSASTAGHSERVSDSISASRSNSPRASMIAVPCSPIGPETSIRSPGRSARGDRLARGSSRAEPGGADVHLVGVAALDDLGVAARRSRPRPLGRRAAIASTSARRSSAARPSSRIRERLERQRPRARHREVVDGPVDRELADRAAREPDAA